MREHVKQGIVAEWTILAEVCVGNQVCKVGKG